MGDSPVLCLCVVQGKVWMGMEMGCLVVYDANTRKPYLQVRGERERERERRGGGEKGWRTDTVSCSQTWIRHYKQILSMAHLSPLRLVYVGLEDGSILAFDEDLPSPPLVSLDPTLTNPPLISLQPVCQYRDSTQTSSCLLAIPCSSENQSNQSNQSGGQDQEGPSLSSSSSSSLSSPCSYELWVGQKGNRITVLDAATLKVIKFLHNELDQSFMPSYVAYLSCSHLVYGCSSARGGGVAGVKGEGAGGVVCDHMSVYSALYHGKFVTRWSASRRKPVNSFDCRPHSTTPDKGQCEATPTQTTPIVNLFIHCLPDCSITALLYSNMELAVGLNCGLILILHPFSFTLLCSLSCHRDNISSLLSLDLSQQLQLSSASYNTSSCPPSSSFSNDMPTHANAPPTCPICRYTRQTCMSSTCISHVVHMHVTCRQHVHMHVTCPHSMYVHVCHMSYTC